MHHSYLGKIDTLVCGNSDPGTSGLLSPFAKINGMYFDDTPEEYDFYFQLSKELEKRAKKNGINYITCEFKNAEDFYNALHSMDKYADDNLSVYGTSREGLYEMIIQDETDMDDLDKDKLQDDKKVKETTKDEDE